uniref:Cytidyltransferase-like domain-containing protein n=1 Tax=viral metagenome TaxID=1070528 RepID=A0A6C0IVJ4_9ZZZZ
MEIEAFSQLNDLRQLFKKKKIGITFSCFDLLHSGHILMLKDAKTKCDILIVGLQKDPTLDRPEKNKPILSLNERKISLESIKYIDYIIIYESEQQLLEILDNLNPDIRFLGSDYIGKNFTGKDKDIEIYYHDRFIHSYSTSNLRKRVYNIERLRQNID